MADGPCIQQALSLLTYLGIFTSSHSQTAVFHLQELATLLLPKTAIGFPLGFGASNLLH